MLNNNLWRASMLNSSSNNIFNCSNISSSTPRRISPLRPEVVSSPRARPPPLHPLPPPPPPHATRSRENHPTFPGGQSPREYSWSRTMRCVEN